MLWTYERVMFGPITKKVNETIRDLNAREIATMVPLMVLMVVMGLYPKFIIARIEPSIGEVLGRVHSAQARIDEERQTTRVAETGGDASPVIRPFSVILSAAKDLREAISSEIIHLAQARVGDERSVSGVAQTGEEAASVILKQAQRGRRISNDRMSLPHSSATPDAWLECSNIAGDFFSSWDSSASVRSAQNDNSCAPLTSPSTHIALLSLADQ
jgi:hypothetical protein